MSKVTFSGNVSAQAKAGELITIKVTNPDGTIDTITTTTLADNTFSIVKDYDIPGNYSALFHVDANGKYEAADYGPVPFVVPLQPRTLTATVTVG